MSSDALEIARRAFKRDFFFTARLATSRESNFSKLPDGRFPIWEVKSDAGLDYVPPVPVFPLRGKRVNMSRHEFRFGTRARKSG